MCQCTLSSRRGTYRGSNFGRRWVTEDEEFDEKNEKKDDGELAEEEALSKRESKGQDY
jgi:hypothetical protein